MKTKVQNGTDWKRIICSLFTSEHQNQTKSQNENLEIEQITRNRRDRSQGNHSAFGFRTEFEYGFTDSFQGALYINTGHMAAKGAPDDDDVQGISTEFIYRVSSPYTDPIGFALYFEPAFDAHDLHNGLKYDLSFENEFRLIFQKNFFDDTLVVAFNTIAEIEFIRFEGEEGYNG